MLFSIIYTNYNHKPVAKIKEPIIYQDKFKELASKKAFKLLKKKRGEK